MEQKLQVIQLLNESGRRKIYHGNYTYKTGYEVYMCAYLCVSVDIGKHTFIYF